MSRDLSVPEEASAEPPLLDAEDLYQRLERFIWWRAHQLTASNRNHVLLETDDVASEMFLTLVECWEKYHKREDIDADAMLKIVRASCNNKCSALIVRYYKRKSRCGDMRQVSIDEILEITELGEIASLSSTWEDQGQRRAGGWSEIDMDKAFEGASECDVERLLESENRISVFMTKLSRREDEIVRAILTMDERLARRAHLESIRRAFVHPRAGPLSLDYRLVADALHLEYGSAKNLWYSIRRKWQAYQISFEKGD